MRPIGQDIDDRRGTAMQQWIKGELKDYNALESQYVTLLLSVIGNRDSPDESLIVQRVTHLHGIRVVIRSSWVHTVQRDEIVVRKGEEEVVVRIGRVVTRCKGLRIVSRGTVYAREVGSPWIPISS